MTDTLKQDRPAAHLDSAEVAWLTTVTGSGQPQSSPVWFLWDGSSFWLRSQAAAGKVRNIQANPKVAIHLSDDGHGGDVVTVDGTASLGEEPPDGLLDRYLTKYAAGIKGLQMTPEQLAADYPTTIRITPKRTRAW